MLGIGTRPAYFDHRACDRRVRGNDVEFRRRDGNRYSVDDLAVAEAVAQLIIARLCGHLQSDRVTGAGADIADMPVATKRRDLDIVVLGIGAFPAYFDHRSCDRRVRGDDVEFRRRDGDRHGMDDLTVAEAVAQLIIARLYRHLQSDRVTGAGADIADMSVAADRGDLDIVCLLVRSDPADLDHRARGCAIRRNQCGRWRRRLEHHRISARLPLDDGKLRRLLLL